MVCCIAFPTHRGPPTQASKPRRLRGYRHHFWPCMQSWKRPRPAGCSPTRARLDSCGGTVAGSRPIENARRAHNEPRHGMTEREAPGNARSKHGKLSIWRGPTRSRPAEAPVAGVQWVTAFGIGTAWHTRDANASSILKPQVPLATSTSEERVCICGGEV